jgi:hypothetical protein
MLARAITPTSCHGFHACTRHKLQGSSFCGEQRADEQGDAAPQRRQLGEATIEIELYGARIHLRGGVDVQMLRSVLAVLAQR